MNLLQFDKQPIYCIADIHGQFDFVFKRILNKKLSDCILIVCGDIGLGFFRPFKVHEIFSKWNSEFAKVNIHCVMLRGNHDDKTWFDASLIKYSNMCTILDYTVIQVGDKNILAVGGAISIDRTLRKSAYKARLEAFQTYSQFKSIEDVQTFVTPTYWENEIPFYDEEKLDELKRNGILIHGIVTHTSPSFAFKKDKKGIDHWLKKDASLEEDLKKEREVFDQIYSKLLADGHPLESWVYGHFHEHYTELCGGVRFTALINADYELDIVPLFNIY